MSGETNDRHEQIAASGYRCACKSACGDVAERDDDPRAVCKGLAVKREPLVEIVTVTRG